jgi:DNA-directed RNA polymerase subunit L
MASKKKSNLVEVSHITVKKRKFGEDNPNLKKCMSYIEKALIAQSIAGKKNIGEELEKCIPDGEQFEVDYKLSNTNSGFANAINRCMMDEIEIFSLSCNDDDVETNDDYILSDNFKRTIMWIPIQQPSSKHEEQEYEKLKFTMNVENKTDALKPIYSSDIVHSKGKKYFTQNILLFSLRPYTYVKCNFYIVSGLAKRDGGAFATCANMRYKCIGDKSSLMMNYSEFQMGYTTYRNFTDNPFFLIHKTSDTLVERLEQAYDLVDMQQSSSHKQDKVHKHDDEHKHQNKYDEKDIHTKLKVEINNNVYRFQFIDEYWTLANMISMACYILNKEIPFTSPNILHPSIETGVVVIKDPEPYKAILDAIKFSIENVKSFKSHFKA